MTLLVGTATTGQATASANPSAELDVYQFVAVATGTLATITVRSSAVANTATSVIFAIYTDSANVPATLLGSVTLAGTPAISSDVVGSGFSVSITSGTTYWIGVLPIGGTFNSTATLGTGIRVAWRTGQASAPSPWGTSSGSSNITSYPIRGDDAPVTTGGGSGNATPGMFSPLLNPLGWF
jgi:hypothetical protein